jgi:hypothetical protein
MDHIKRETLQLATLKYFVLDEADEMLRMGFIDDVEWILEQAPRQRQIALFSATMPAAIRRIAQNHLRNPAEVTIKSKTSTATKIRQRYWVVSGMHKLDALTRILEAEPFEGMLVFTRTKLATSLVLLQVGRDAVLAARLAVVTDAIAGVAVHTVFVTDGAPIGGQALLCAHRIATAERGCAGENSQTEQRPRTKDAHTCLRGEPRCRQT